MWYIYKAFHSGLHHSPLQIQHPEMSMAMLVSTVQSRDQGRAPVSLSYYCSEGPLCHHPCQATQAPTDFSHTLTVTWATVGAFYFTHVQWSGPCFHSYLISFSFWSRILEFCSLFKKIDSLSFCHLSFLKSYNLEMYYGRFLTLCIPMLHNTYLECTVIIWQ